MNKLAGPVLILAFLAGALFALAQVQHNWDRSRPLYHQER